MAGFGCGGCGGGDDNMNDDGFAWFCLVLLGGKEGWCEEGSSKLKRKKSS